MHRPVSSTISYRNTESNRHILSNRLEKEKGQVGLKVLIMISIKYSVIKYWEPLF